MCPLCWPGTRYSSSSSLLTRLAAGSAEYGVVRLLGPGSPGEGDEAALRELRILWSLRSGKGSMVLRADNTGSREVVNLVRW
jgi:hypothetical protein